MDDIERLVAIQEIKQVKAKYFWGLDHKDWEFWRREVWAPDARLIVPEANRDEVGIDAVIAYVSNSTADQVSVHHGHMPDIEITSDTTATGIWAMEDKLIWRDGSRLHGFGHYHETYRKEADGEWRIATLDLTRLRLDHTPAPAS